MVTTGHKVPQIHELSSNATACVEARTFKRSSHVIGWIIPCTPLTFDQKQEFFPTLHWYVILQNLNVFVMCILFVKVSHNIEHEQFTTLWAINSILFYLYSDKSYVKRTLHPPRASTPEAYVVETWLEGGTVPLSSQCSPLFSAGSLSVEHGWCYWKGEALKTSWAMQHCKEEWKRTGWGGRNRKRMQICLWQDRTDVRGQ